MGDLRGEVAERMNSGAAGIQRNKKWTAYGDSGEEERGEELGELHGDLGGWLCCFWTFGSQSDVGKGAWNVA